MAQSMMRNAKRLEIAGMAPGFVRRIGRLSMMLIALCLVSPPARGAEDRVMDKEIIVTENGLNVSVRYPVLRIAAIDADIQDWAQQTVSAFISEFSEVPNDRVYELKATYRIVRASQRVVSVIWDVWNFTGGAHGNLDIVAFVYDSGSGQLLELRDLFEDEQGALNLLSVLSYGRLPAMLGDMADEEMIRSGTSPDLDNFACVAPTPEGVRVFFQPYQVAPWAAGLQEVDVSLQELQDAGPRREYRGAR
jgi:hypothetical protein